MSDSNKKTSSGNHDGIYDVIVVGAGAAGVGVAISLQHVGIENFVIVDRDTVGASFAAWPAETRFITPSFPSNSIGMLDLNSVAIGVSPAYNMRVEHPTGAEFAEHLQSLANYFELPVKENTNVTSIEKDGEVFHVQTESGLMKAKHVIWSAGEYQYPSLSGFAGVEHCRHTATVAKYGDLEGDDFLIIGGYESGIDAAYHLARNDKQVRVFDMEGPWESQSSDPSIALSTYSFERMRHEKFDQNVQLHANTIVTLVNHVDDTYQVTTGDGQTFTSKVAPLFAGGFDGSHKFVSHLFNTRDDGFPEINENDESTITPGMYLCGPSVRHDGHIFCFIFKYRQRFAIVAQAIASAMGLPTDEFIEAYKSWGMYLDDLSCCGQECLTC
tara:strand:- start:9418 stop:10572 length:1155 start_codon:yes stop_codon:yes gene_type:complete